MASRLLANIVKALGSDGVASTAAGTVATCVQAGSLAGIAAALAPGALVAAPFVGLLVAGAVFEWRRDKRDRADLDRSLRDLHRALQRVEEAQRSNADWQGLVDELLGGRIERVEQHAGDPQAFVREVTGAITASVGDAVTQDGEQTRAHIDAWEGSLYKELSELGQAIGRVETNQSRQLDLAEEAQTGIEQNRAMLEELLRRTDAAEARLADPSRERDLAGALDAVQGLAARGDASATTALADGDTRQAAAVLLAETRRVREAKRRALEAVNAREIELNREASALAQAAGDLDGAEEASNRVLDLAPNDPETFNRLGLIALDRNDLPAAVVWFERLAKHATDTGGSATGWYNWGVVLGQQAEEAAGEERARLRSEEISKYAAAVDAKPDYYEALYNWGLALGQQADESAGEERARLRSEEISKYAAAVDVKPDDHEALHNWGVALGQQADESAGAERARLRSESISKYAAAVEVKPDGHDALSNWGVALWNQADEATGEERARLCSESISKFAAAVDAKPDDHKALHNWGVALWNQANDANAAGDAANACRLLREAVDRFEQAGRDDAIAVVKQAMAAWGCG